LPGDLTPELCETVTRLHGTPTDPILGKVAADDFRARRTPLIKRMTVPRLGQVPAGDKRPRRYLVRVRQEWHFLGYTLGELAGVDALDPGAVLEEVSRTVQQVVDRASRATDDARTSAASVLSSSLSQLSSVDTVID